MSFNASGNFYGLEIRHRIFRGLHFGPGIFWVLIIAPIRSSLSVEIRSTPTPGHNAPNNGSANSQPSRHYGRKATLPPRIRGTFRMPSNPGQNLHLVESSSHLVVSSVLLTSPLLVYSSAILQLVVSPFNSSCRTSTRRSLYPFSISVYPYILKPWSCLITNCGNNKTV